MQLYCKKQETLSPEKTKPLKIKYICFILWGSDWNRTNALSIMSACFLPLKIQSPYHTFNNNTSTKKHQSFDSWKNV